MVDNIPAALAALEGTRGRVRTVSLKLNDAEFDRLQRLVDRLGATRSSTCRALILGALREVSQ